MKFRVIALLALLCFSLSARAASIEVGFSPDGGAEQLVVRVIEEARHEILVAAYSFTDKRIARALVDASRRGVRVRAILDKSQRSEHYTAATFLANEGIPVRIDSRHAIFHDKYIICDGRTVETGSFNYTNSAATHNAENAIVIRDDSALAQEYVRNWMEHWSHSEPYAARY
jgi:phosphatidylserine/phosphatidylglycerophosphate/cardiolipin synthase-like enzyme